jgi:hypothetical protein
MAEEPTAAAAAGVLAAGVPAAAALALLQGLTPALTCSARGSSQLDSSISRGVQLGLLYGSTRGFGDQTAHMSGPHDIP